MNIIVFLGPSLPLVEAKQLLPDAHFLPPAQCGDVLRALRLKPDVIAIIDGLFERVAALWHKEVLVALERGVQVFGASSMGALRAAELAEFGMQGVGKIFTAFHEGVLNDDDEVAILHGPLATGFRATTDAMVNIRETLQAAVAANIISSEKSAAIEMTAKQYCYTERRLKKAIATTERLEDAERSQLTVWIKDGGYRDQKAADARELLRHLSKLPVSANKPPNVKAHRSAFLRALMKYIQCRPFLTEPEWLPQDEKIARTARVLGPLYLGLQRLAYNVMALETIALSQGYACPAGADAFDFLGQTRDATVWSQVNDCSEPLLQHLQEKARLISGALSHAENNPPEDIVSLEIYFLVTLRFYQQYARLKAQAQVAGGDDARIIEYCAEAEPQLFYVFWHVARLWRATDILAMNEGLEPQESQVIAYMNEYRLKYGLEEVADLEAWLADNDLDDSFFFEMMRASARFDGLVFRNQLDYFGSVAFDEDTHYLMAVIRMLGFYPVLKALTQDKTHQQQLLQKSIDISRLSPEAYAHYHDFGVGEAVESYQQIKEEE